MENESDQNGSKCFFAVSIKHSYNFRGIRQDLGAWQSVFDKFLGPAVTGIAQIGRYGFNKAFLKFQRNWPRFVGVRVSLWRILGTDSDQNEKKSKRK